MLMPYYYSIAEELGTRCRVRVRFRVRVRVR